MSSTAPVGSAPADQLVFDLPEILPQLLVGRPKPGPVGRVVPARRERSLAKPAASPGEHVWLVWEDDDVLGVYGDPAVAARDVEALRRNAVRAGTAVTYECLPVPVFMVGRHRGR